MKEKRKIEFDIGFDDSRESAERIIYGIYGMSVEAFADALRREAVLKSKSTTKPAGGVCA
ncbi:MAG: hypothetical protein IJA02_08790 [Clostridia bacterium]|nr:hypothetical protein [Clostridia bacterium]